MNKQLKRIELRQCTSEFFPSTIRLSVFFDDAMDNHHIAFPSNITREDLLTLLVHLQYLIETGGQRRE